MPRGLCILLWTIFFFVLPTLFFGGVIAFLYHEDSDPPTELAFVSIGCCSPVSAVIGFSASLAGWLPGTAKWKGSPEDQKRSGK